MAYKCFQMVKVYEYGGITNENKCQIKSNAINFVDFFLK